MSVSSTVRVRPQARDDSRARLKIGIGLPAMIPNTMPELILEWARRAEAKGFSSLGITDRLAYPNYESLIVLASAAAVTTRIRLMTTILIAPLRNTALLAKQAATLDRLSGGRLTLGLAVGGREDDFLAAQVPFKGRGRRFEQQLALMKRVWTEKRIGDIPAEVGPAPTQRNGPEILIGGYAPVAISRVGKWGDGIITGGGGDANRAASAYRLAQEAWQREGRSGRPRLVCTSYFALGPNASERGTSYLKDYYRFAGPMAEVIAKGMLADEGQIRNAINAFSSVGADEVIFWPCVPELEQVDRLANLI